jgi:glycosyltransferase involved in cell wall biosynthesis
MDDDFACNKERRQCPFSLEFYTAADSARIEHEVWEVLVEISEMPRIGILVVAYNAQSTLRGVIQRIPAQVMDKVGEIFVFDDASSDQTHAVGKQLVEELQLHEGKLLIYRNLVNLMYGGNQKRGYRYAIDRGFDYVVLLHGDGQYAPEVMQDLLAPLEAGEAEMVMGSRMMIPGAARAGNMPMYKYVGNKILTRIENTLIGQNFSEFHSGYRAYSVRALEHIPLERLTWNWHFDTQIILEFLKRGYRIKEVPIPTYYGDEICHVNGIPYALNCIREAFRYAIQHRLRAPSHQLEHDAPAGSLPAAPGPQK